MPNYTYEYLLENAEEYLDCCQYTLKEVVNYHPYELQQTLIEYAYDGLDTGGDDYLRQAQFGDLAMKVACEVQRRAEKQRKAAARLGEDVDEEAVLDYVYYARA